ncbi:hypothetical protein [Aurantiacibacter sp. D1-12]|uniref:hypothetical protein n=1 Tax=Aurantiacibacter sp. D1-12 TaxID=2993658 RepID=UPI00237CCCFB|nr:hypothetical protein [Aurantiacibacter sp. D1-12]MDE1468173.1 hypothetical protein [Aurantiacibacter sp. D1-12]
MWLSWGLFFALIAYSVAFGPFRLHREPLFSYGFVVMLAAIVLQFWLARRAYKSVHCGKCKHRFFDRMFVIFPTKHGCSKCDASLDHAFLYQEEG